MDKVARHINPISTEFFKLTKVASFKELNLPVIKHDAIDLLTGSDFEELLGFTDVRRSSEYRVAAKLSIFGWLLVGNTGPRDGIDYNDEEKRSCDSIHVHRAYLVEDKYAEALTPCSGDLSSCKLLHEEIERYIAVDVSCQNNNENTAPAMNDLRYNSIHAKSIRKEGGRYFLDLPVKDNLHLADNRERAKVRLMQQRKSLKRNPELENFSTKTVQQLINTDKLELVDEDSGYVED